MKDVNLLTSNGVNVQKSLELFGTIEKYNTTMETFLKTIGENLNKLKTYKEASDMPKYAVLVHAIKSEARYFGFDLLADMAYQHELESKASNIEYITNNFNSLENEIKKAISLMTQYFSSSASTNNVTDGIKNDNPKKEGFLSKLFGKKTKEKKLVSKYNKILVVDDSDTIRNYIKSIFKDEFEVILASDGEEALTIIEKNPDMRLLGMLLDLSMPNVDGFSVLDYLKTRDLFSKIPVCIITSTDINEINQRASEYPIIDILNKPFNEKDIKEKIEKIIKSNTN